MSTGDITKIRALFVEDRFATRLAIDRFTSEYPFNKDYAEDFPEFKIKFDSFKPNVVIVDYDLKKGKYHNEISQIVYAESEKTNSFIGLIGVTAYEPFVDIQKDFKSAKFHSSFFDDGSKDFFLDVIAEFYKIAKKL